MNCPACAEPNSKGAQYCEQCGEPLTASAIEARRDADRRERRAREIEVAEAVATRLVRWGRMLLFAAAIPVAVLTFIVGKAYFDIPKAFEEAKSDVSATSGAAISQINVSKEAALKNIAGIENDLSPLKEQILHMKTDFAGY